jgi:hypothetical protein
MYACEHVLLKPTTPTYDSTITITKNIVLKYTFTADKNHITYGKYGCKRSVHKASDCINTRATFFTYMFTYLSCNKCLATCIC